MTIITISRFTMSGGERLAKCLSEKLGIPAISREVITQVADQFDISEARLWETLEKTKHGAPAERSLYLAAMQLALAERAREGPFVYHGLAGHFLLKGIPQILKVGIVAPLKMRAERLMREKGISMDEAIRSIQRWDERRSKWVRFLYDVDWLNPSLYDLVINIANIGTESACELVICALNQKEFKELPEKQWSIDDFVLASRVKAQLALNTRTKGLELEVEVANQVVRITGRVLTGGVFHWGGKESTRNDLVEVAKTVPGVQKVLVDLEERAVPLD
jgi:cytidylate kinase